MNDKNNKDESYNRKNIGVALEYLNRKNEYEELRQEIDELERKLKRIDSPDKKPEKIALDILRKYSKENYKLEDDWSDKLFSEMLGSGKKVIKSGLDRILSTQVPQLAEDLNLSETCQRRAINIIKKAENLGIAYGKKPAGILAAAIYMAAIDCGEWRSEVEISQAAGVSKSSLFEIYKELSDNLE